MTRRNAVAACAVALLVVGARPAVALNLDATDWTGRVTCKGVTAFGEKDTTKEEVTFNVNQAGPGGFVLATFPGNVGVTYEFRLLDDVAKPAIKGVLAMTYTGNGPDADAFAELISGTVTFDATTGKGKFTAKAVRSGGPFDPLASSTCTWSFKRVIP
jgi:hypothetical protein